MKATTWTVMRLARVGVFLAAGTLGLGAAPAPPRAAAKAKSRLPLYLDLIDMTGPQFGPPVYGLEDRRRGPIFADAVRDAAKAGELPPTVFVNDDLARLAGVNYRAEREKVPAGATVLRVFITRWTKTREGGAFNTEVYCRLFAEAHRDGQRVAKLGPFFGSVRLRTFLDPDYQREFADFGAAARQAVGRMARALPETGVAAEATSKH